MGFLLSCVCYAFVRVCLYVPCGHLLGKGWPLGSSFWFLTVSLSFYYWYPGSGVVLDLSIPDLCTLTYLNGLTLYIGSDLSAVLTLVDCTGLMVMVAILCKIDNMTKEV